MVKISNYILYAVMALIFWTLFALFAKVGTSSMKWPSVVMLAYLILTPVVFLSLFSMGKGNFSLGNTWPFALGAGIAGGLGGVFFYRAVGSGPVSVVTPIAGSYIVTSSVLGMLILGEDFTPTKILAIALVFLAILLFSF